MIHTQWNEDIFCGKGTQRLFRNPLNDVLQRDIVKTAVLHCCFGLKIALTLSNILHQFLWVGGAELLLQGLYRGVSRQSGSVGKQVYDTDVGAIFVAAVPTFKLGQITFYRVVDAQ